MKKGFTVVELIVCVCCVLIFIAVFLPMYLHSKTPSLPGPSIYRLERPLKQFVVSQGGISGSFFLGCGGISGGEKEYYFYYKTKEGNKFRPGSVSLTKSSIIEDGQNKVVFVTKPLEKYEISKLENEIDQWNFWGSDIQEFEFHIPPGSILEEYNPNLLSSN